MKKFILLTTLISLFVSTNSVFANQVTKNVPKQTVEITIPQKQNIYKTRSVEVDMDW